jgi:hypothetical protein
VIYEAPRGPLVNLNANGGIYRKKAIEPAGDCRSDQRRSPLTLRPVPPPSKATEDEYERKDAKANGERQDNP